MSIITDEMVAKVIAAIYADVPLSIGVPVALEAIADDIRNQVIEECFDATQCEECAHAVRALQSKP